MFYVQECWCDIMWSIVLVIEHEGRIAIVDRKRIKAIVLLYDSCRLRSLDLPLCRGTLTSIGLHLGLHETIGQHTGSHVHVSYLCLELLQRFLDLVQWCRIAHHLPQVIHFGVHLLQIG